MSYLKNTNKKYILNVILIFILFVFPVQKAGAVVSPVVPIVNDAASIAAMSSTAASSAGLAANELAETTRNLIKCMKDEGPACVPSITTLDLVTHTATKTLVSELIRSTTDWIKKGFPSGGPTFVQDLKKFYENEAYKVLDLYIQDIAGVDMCNLFPDLQTTINLSGPKTSVAQARCTLKDIRGDFMDFQTDFQKGEWLTFEPSLKKNNNTFGLYIFTQAEVHNKVAKNEEDQKTKLGWAKGFFSFEEQMRDDKGVMRKTGRVLTPGSFVEQELNSTFGVDIRNLQVADELDELVSALIQQAIAAAFREGTKQGFFQ